MKVRIFLKTLLLIIAVASWFGSGDVKCQNQVSLRKTVTHLLYSAELNQHYLVDVFLPKGYQTKESEYQFPKYPVIYVLNSRPNAVMAAMMRHVSELSREIIVGIDFADKDGNPVESFASYTRDLTPTSDNDWVEESNTDTVGRAEDFINFINNQVKPLINKTYNVNKYNQTLVGHSFGGLFGLFVLFKHSDSFNRYVIASPSLWWDNNVMFKLEEIYAGTHTNLAKKVFLSVGSKEFESGPQGMIDNVRKMSERLKDRNYPDLELSFNIFEDETHLSVVGISIHKGIDVVFK
ncbi:MAG: hypothetical protein K9J12_18300 [Melioribacteraceae bacterium]|nr:hypothetical protein [Melioribacteraceae bacterium]MCF8263386.1 hypothetical protein [Melioribacteraceae bacterium]MCF8430872.1 hypothetical protein [Melioribacteraceae bacterium]